MNKEYEFNLEKFFYVVRRRIVWVLLIGLLSAVVMAVLGSFLIVPEYSSTAKLYVNTTKDQNTYITQSDLTVAKSLVSTYIVVIESDTVLEQVAYEANVGYTPEQIRKNMKAESISGTEAFSVTVSNPDSAVAKRIADAIVKVAPDEILRVVEAGSVKIIDSPKEAVIPDESGLKIFTAIAFIFGALISFVAFFLAEVLDVTVYSEEDLTRQFDCAVLGIIPTIIGTGSDSKEKNRNRKGGASSDEKS